LEKYIKAEINIEEFDVVDVILTSGIKDDREDQLPVINE